MIVLTLCRKENLCKELWGFARAFERQGITLACVEWATPLNVDVRKLIEKCPGRPDFILQPESDFDCLPAGLTELDVPTVCFHFDTFHSTTRRIRWSMLYDIPVIFHPHFEDRYRRAGHPCPLTLAHAAQQDFYETESNHRPFEVGWVGRLEGAPFAARKRILPKLAGEFRMNDWNRYYTLEETAQIYLHSSTVVNIGRDDYPQDANMRVFEAMAAGALLITKLPTNLSALGFVDGEHFIGFRQELEIAELIRHYLRDEEARLKITRAARELVLEKHTYDARVKSLVEFVAENGHRLAAPARRWHEEKVRLAYLDYYSATFSMTCAYEEFRWLARRSLRCAIKGAGLIGRSWVRLSLNQMQGWAHGTGS